MFINFKHNRQRQALVLILCATTMIKEWITAYIS